MPLTQGLVALVSAHRYQIVVGEGLWHAARCRSQVYARRSVRAGGVCRHVYLHRMITGAPDGFHVDHVNGDGLDCRDENLRVVPPQHNSWNRDGNPGASGYIGVTGHGRRWRARITLANGDRRTVGNFNTAYEAALAYDAAALRERGPFARINFVFSRPPQEPDDDHPIPF